VLARIGGKGMSYIVKNCPCYEFGFCTSHHIKVRGCINCTDCVIKQAIEECKWETNIDVNDRGDLAERILSSFDIEEINK
jgi:hypothetical protein